jgi:uridylate kinase
MDQFKGCKRVLIKLSGESLMGSKEFGHDLKTIDRISSEISNLHKSGVQVSIVVGGGNIFRGMQAASIGMERASADQMGMLATIMNAIALQHSLEKKGSETRILSAIPMMSICEPYIRRKALRHMEKDRIVIFAAGTGNPFFTTDTAAALRAIEMNCDLLLKATQVDGVYDSDPKINKHAKKFDLISYSDILTKNLKVMDASAISLARENKLPIVVFSITKKGHLENILKNKTPNTIIKDN